MSQSRHIPKKERFVSFRFEQSLRKYEPPVRKFRKPEHHNCNHSHSRSRDAIQKERLARLCETRKKYQITSREQASEYSRKKDRQLDSSRANRQSSVSDFDCSDPFSTQNQWQAPLNELIDPNQEKINKKQLDRIFSRTIEETPIKEQIRKNLQREEEDIFRQMQELQQQSRNKTKDIDFHIGRVQKLHDQFMKEYGGSPSSNSYIQTKIQKDLLMMERTNKFIIREPDQEYYKSQQPKIYIKQNMPAEIMDQQEEQEEDDKMLEKLFLQDLQRLSLQQEPDQQEAEQLEIMKSYCNKENANVAEGIKGKSCQKLFRQKKLFALCEISVQNGRIRIQGDKGPCYLSKRNLLKLFSQGSFSQVTQKVKTIHPYLNDPTQALESLIMPNFHKNQTF